MAAWWEQNSGRARAAAHSGVLDDEVLAADGVHDDRRPGDTGPGLELGVRGLKPLLVCRRLADGAWIRMEQAASDPFFQEVSGTGILHACYVTA